MVPAPVVAKRRFVKEGFRGEGIGIVKTLDSGGDFGIGLIFRSRYHSYGVRG